MRRAVAWTTVAKFHLQLPPSLSKRINSPHHPFLLLPWTRRGAPLAVLSVPLRVMGCVGIGPCSTFPRFHRHVVARARLLRRTCTWCDRHVRHLVERRWRTWHPCISTETSCWAERPQVYVQEEEREWAKERSGADRHVWTMQIAGQLKVSTDGFVWKKQGGGKQVDVSKRGASHTREATSKGKRNAGCTQGWWS